MDIVLNGEKYQTHSENLIELLNELHCEPGTVAVALNSTFVTRADYANHGLQQNDQIEIVAPMAGG
ncbi:sulfur carrier protein ThiS [Aliikangiella sp. IMCC44653]